MGQRTRDLSGLLLEQHQSASEAMGFRRDEVGKLLRKNRGANTEGYAIFEEAWFTTAKFVES